MIVLEGLLAVAFALGGWILAFIVWRRDPDAVKRAAEEMRTAAARLDKAAKALEDQSRDIEANVVLSCLSDQTEMPVRRERVDQIIENVFLRIGNRVIEKLKHRNE